MTDTAENQRPQQRLNFLPLPQGQASFRPTLALGGIRMAFGTVWQSGQCVSIHILASPAKGKQPAYLPAGTKPDKCRSTGSQAAAGPWT
jgi:hypothetical protein